MLLRSLGWTDDVDDLPLTHYFGYVEGYQEVIETARCLSRAFTRLNCRLLCVVGECIDISHRRILGSAFDSPGQAHLQGWPRGRHGALTGICETASVECTTEAPNPSRTFPRRSHVALSLMSRVYLRTSPADRRSWTGCHPLGRYRPPSTQRCRLGWQRTDTTSPLWCPWLTTWGRSQQRISAMMPHHWS